MKSWRDYEADFEARIARYREGAQLVRSAAKMMSSDRRARLFEIATELEQLHKNEPEVALRGSLNPPRKEDLNFVNADTRRVI